MDDFYCNFCDKTNKLKHKKKLLNTKSHMDLSEFVINKYCVQNPELIDIEKYLKNLLVIIIKGLNFTILYASGNYRLLILKFMLNLRECIVTDHVLG